MRLLGVDIGGTFTDTVLTDGHERYSVKTATTGDIISGAATGVREACDRAGIEPGAVDGFSHASTVAVNALIEGTGAKTAIISTAGFRDILEIGEGFRDANLLYNPCGEHEPPLIPRRYRYGVTERMDADGGVRVPLDLADVDEVIDRITATRIEAVAVSFLHAHVNPEHERQVAERFAQRAPDIDVSISSAVSPQIREYSRTSTTAVDAYLKPTVSTYLGRFSESLDDLGPTAINIMQSDGGLAKAELAAERPVTQIISGPVAGVKAAQLVAETVGLDNVLTLDMGGTSCDTAMIEGGQPVEVPHRYVRGLKINGPFTNIETVGAGGGSIAWLDEVGALRVGPRSAGADPGPVCYGRGGDEPTVTDADLVLGLLNPDNFAGGTMQLDVDRSHEAIREQVAEPLGLSVEEAAIAIRDVIDSTMASAIRVVSVNEGADPREFALMGFGGAGPMHVCDIATELDIETVVIPSSPGVLSSVGLIAADIRHEYTRSLVVTVDEVDAKAVTESIGSLIDRGDEELAFEDVAPGDRSFTVSFDMMYSGQAHHLNVPLPGSELNGDTLAELVERFEHEHDRQYGFTDDRNPVELINVRVTARGEVPDPDLEWRGDAEADPEAARRGYREVVLDAETRVDVPFFDWTALGPGHDLGGPAMVELDTSLVWLPPGWDAHVDGYKNMIATRGDTDG